MNREKDISFAEQLKLEAEGVMTLTPEFMKEEEEKRLGVDCRIASSLGREITEKEFMVANI